MSKLAAATELKQTPGQMIKAAREARQVSLSEVAQNLLLSKQTLIALEEDDYSKIPAEVYAKGYLKAYAKFLQIPVESIITSFRELSIYFKVESKSEIKPKLECKFAVLLKDQRMLLGLLAALVISILLLVAFKSIDLIDKDPEISNQSASVGEVANGADDGVFNKERLSVVTTDSTVGATDSASKKKHGDDDSFIEIEDKDLAKTKKKQ